MLSGYVEKKKKRSGPCEEPVSRADDRLSAFVPCRPEGQRSRMFSQLHHLYEHARHGATCRRRAAFAPLVCSQEGLEASL